MAGNFLASGPLSDDDGRPADLVPFTDHAPPAPVEEPREEGVNWGRYVSALKRYRWLMLLIVVVGSSAGVIATRFIPPSFSTQATIWVQSGGAKNGPIRPAELLSQGNWVELLRSNTVYDPVVQRLHLYLTPENPADSALFSRFDIGPRFQVGKFLLETTPDGARWKVSANGAELARGAVGDSIGTTLGWKWAPSAAEVGRDRKVTFVLRQPREVSGMINSSLSASLPEDGNFMRVSLEGEDRKALAPTLNALVHEFVDVAADLKRRQLTEFRLALDSQVITARQNLHDAEARLKNYQIQTITQPRNGAFAVAPGLVATQGAATSQYFTQKAQLEGLRTDRQQLETVLARTRAGELTADAFQTIPAAKAAPQLGQALADLTRAQSEYAALGQRYTPEHPAMKNIATQIDDLRRNRIPELAQALIDQLKYQEKDLDSRIESAGRELKEVPTVTITEMALQREYTAADALYNMLAQRLEEAKLAELSAIPDVRILDEAVTPTRPSSNTAPKVILMAFMGSVGFAVGLALLLDQLDPRFRYPEQVTNELGLAILGAVPAFRKSRGGEIATEQAMQVVEAFRTIRLNLAHSYGAAGPVMLTISSPGAGDGKSLISSNLAVSFAEAGYRTLLIDGDIRRGELHRMFGVDRRPGLLDFLTGSAMLEEIVRPTSQAGLWLLPCGTRRHQGPELLGSAAMASLMAAVKARFNVIIVDSPPLGAGIDPFVLGTTTGHLLMVFRSGETDRQMAEAKLRLLDRLPVRVLGAVLNEIEAEGVYRYYSYLYGYSSEEEDPAQLASRAANGNGG